MEQKYNIVVVGADQVGKSSLIGRYVSNEFNDEYYPTIGIDYKCKVQVHGPFFKKMQLWDMAGQVRFRSIIQNYCRSATAVIIVYDVTDDMSLFIIREWALDVWLHGNKAVALVANKCDDITRRKISTEDGQQAADSLGLSYYEVSAKTGQGVNEFFDGLIKRNSNNMKNTSPRKEGASENEIYDPDFSAANAFRHTVQRYKYSRTKELMDSEWTCLKKQVDANLFLANFMPPKRIIIIPEPIFSAQDNGSKNNQDNDNSGTCSCKCTIC